MNFDFNVMRKKLTNFFEVGRIASKGILLLALLASTNVAGAFSLFSNEDSLPLVVCGDSLSQGVQSGDANLRTQAWSFASLMAKQMQVALGLPLIVSSPIGVVGDVSHRHRLNPFARGTNLARSGANVADVVGDSADAYFPWEIDSENDLVLYPRQGTQLEITQQLDAEVTLCWVGSNDIWPAVVAYDQLDASQMTEVSQFTEDLRTLVAGLAHPDKKLVMGTIPDMTQIAFLMDRDEAKRFLGEDVFAEDPTLLPDGHLTSVVAVFHVKLGLEEPTILAKPGYLLDPDEIGRIQARVNELNEAIRMVIAEVEQSTGAKIALAEVKDLFDQAVDAPPRFFDMPVASCYLCGLFSLDGVHPSNIGHALVANEFIRVLNTTNGMDIPSISEADLQSIFLNDPFQDFDGDLRVSGRPLAGLLETLGPTVLGISGDENAFEPGVIIKHFPSEGTVFFASFTAQHDLLLPGGSFSEPLRTLREAFGLTLLTGR